ncbi:hypothetical protein ACOMHN_007681 [Nucella lapillus]
MHQIREINRPNLKQSCQACENSSPPTIKSVLFHGCAYDRFLLTDLPNADNTSQSCGTYSTARWIKEQTTTLNRSTVHSTMRSKSVTHPCWTFLRHLKDHQTVSEETVTRARRGEAPPRRRRKWRLLEERLVALKRQYNHGDRDLNEYWRAVSHLVLQAV